MHSKKRYQSKNNLHSSKKKINDSLVMMHLTKLEVNKITTSLT